MKYFMLDIETMGIDPVADDVLEIAILEVDLVEGIYKPGRAYQRTLHSSQKTQNEWILNHHKELMKRCMKVPFTTPDKVRAEILSFFKKCVQEGPAVLIGLNLGSLDIPFLLAKGFLQKGDYSYRVYEMTGAIALIQDALDMKRDQVFKTANELGGSEPDGKKHEAIYDCYSQLRTLNGLLSMVRGA
jgi:oligoribonuclease (3'-5' exoribonuclease)